jgi:hypothetical protein
MKILSLIIFTLLEVLTYQLQDCFKEPFPRLFSGATGSGGITLLKRFAISPSTDGNIALSGSTDDLGMRGPATTTN